MNFSLYFIRLSFDNVGMILCPSFVAVNKCFPQETNIIFVVFLNEFNICYSFNVSHQLAAHDPNSDITLEPSRNFQFAGQNEEISIIATVSVGHVMLPHRPAGRKPSRWRLLLDTDLHVEAPQRQTKGDLSWAYVT